MKDERVVNFLEFTDKETEIQRIETSVVQSPEPKLPGSWSSRLGIFKWLLLCINQETPKWHYSVFLKSEQELWQNMWALATNRHNLGLAGWSVGMGAVGHCVDTALLPPALGFLQHSTREKQSIPHWAHYIPAHNLWGNTSLAKLRDLSKTPWCMSSWLGLKLWSPGCRPSVPSPGSCTLGLVCHSPSGRRNCGWYEEEGPRTMWTLWQLGKNWAEGLLGLHRLFWKDQAI